MAVLNDAIHSLGEVVLAAAVTLYALRDVVIDSAFAGERGVLLLVQRLPVTPRLSDAVLSAAKRGRTMLGRRVLASAAVLAGLELINSALQKPHLVAPAFLRVLLAPGRFEPRHTLIFCAVPEHAEVLLAIQRAQHLVAVCDQREDLILEETLGEIWVARGANLLKLIPRFLVYCGRG